MSPHTGWRHLRRLRVFALRSASLRFSMVYDDHSPRCRLHRDAPTIASRRHRVPFSVSAPHLDCVRATSPTPGIDRCADQCRIAGHMSSVEGALLRAAVHGGPRRLLGGACFPTVRMAVRGRSWTFARQVRVGVRTTVDSGVRQRTGQRSGQQGQPSGLCRLVQLLLPLALIVHVMPSAADGGHAGGVTAGSPFPLQLT